VLLVPTRTTYRAQSRFDTPEERVRRNLEFELDLMDATNVVVTTDQSCVGMAGRMPTNAFRIPALPSISRKKVMSRPSPATSGTRSATTWARRC
jgi:hypothetical protein